MAPFFLLSLAPGQEMPAWQTVGRGTGLQTRASASMPGEPGAIPSHPPGPAPTHCLLGKEVPVLSTLNRTTLGANRK